MSADGRQRAEDFSWPRVTAKVEEYYGFVIRRLAASGQLPAGFQAAIPQAPPLRAKPSASSDASSAPRREREPPDPGRVGDDEARHRRSR